MAGNSGQDKEQRYRQGGNEEQEGNARGHIEEDVARDPYRPAAFVLRPGPKAAYVDGEGEGARKKSHEAKEEAGFEGEGRMEGRRESCRKVGKDDYSLEKHRNSPFFFPKSPANPD